VKLNTHNHTHDYAHVKFVVCVLATGVPANPEKFHVCDLLRRKLSHPYLKMAIYQRHGENLKRMDNRKGAAQS
jgi:hypothetical protein